MNIMEYVKSYQEIIDTQDERGMEAREASHRSFISLLNEVGYIDILEDIDIMKLERVLDAITILVGIVGLTKENKIHDLNVNLSIN